MLYEKLVSTLVIVNNKYAAETQGQGRNGKTKTQSKKSAHTYESEEECESSSGEIHSSFLSQLKLSRNFFRQRKGRASTK